MSEKERREGAQREVPPSHRLENCLEPRSSSKRRKIRIVLDPFLLSETLIRCSLENFDRIFEFSDLGKRASNIVEKRWILGIQCERLTCHFRRSLGLPERCVGPRSEDQGARIVGVQLEPFVDDLDCASLPPVGFVFLAQQVISLRDELRRLIILGPDRRSPLEEFDSI